MEQGFMGEEATMDDLIDGFEYSPEELREFLSGDHTGVADESTSVHCRPLLMRLIHRV